MYRTDTCFIKDNLASKREDIEIFLVKIGYDATKMTIIKDLKVILENDDIEKSGLAKVTIYHQTIKPAEIPKPLLIKNKMKDCLVQ